MFYIRYVFAELRRRKARTALTALGLGVGVGLVVAITSLSAGLDDAQSEVLEPLTGVGTDMSVSRPIQVSRSNGESNFSAGPGGNLSGKEQDQLSKENSSLRLNFNNLGDPGEKFSTRNFISTDLSFSAKQAAEIAAIDGVKGVGEALSLNEIAVSGTVPESSSGGGFGGPPGGGGGGQGGNGTQFSQSSVTGIQSDKPDLAPLSPSQIIDGKYLPESGNNAVISQSYAQNKDLEVGDEIKVGKREFEITGIAKAPIGGETSDIYVPLATLQKMSDREGRINALQVRADSVDDVKNVESGIKDVFPGAQVTTASDLADRVGGSLVDAKNLSSKLGTALAIVALLAAFAIASLLTLTSISKRTRELGTLKALGWRQGLVIRQICSESLAQGFLGGLVGAAIGVAASLAIGAVGWTLKASVAAPAQSGGGPPGLGSFGQGAVQAGSNTVTIGAPVDATALVLAIALALIGGLVAGAAGSARVARLRPAEALRSVE